MIKLNRTFILMLFMLFSLVARAQNLNPDNADEMRSNGKIYYVVILIVTILAGLFFYLVKLDKKISKLERM